MKHFFLSIIVSIIIGIILIGGVLYYAFGGLWNAIKTPSQDIALVINEAEENNSDGENKTDLPLHLAEGFELSIFAQDLEAPRDMITDPKGNLLVSITKEGQVLALPDRDQNGKADKTITVIDQLNLPHGLAFRCESESSESPCQLYIAETNQVVIYDYDQETLKASNPRPIIDLPEGGRHFTRSLLFLDEPEGDRLLISVGSTCNVCFEDDWRRSKILVAKSDGSELKEYAVGLRNAVFMTSHPLTKEVWATEMGRDWLGNDLPPDEINIIEEGKNYGWPICYGKNNHDSDFDKNQYIKNPCQEPDSSPSFINIPAHSSPLGLAFFPEEGWPETFQYDLLVANHGSWNREPPIGYSITRYHFDEQGQLIDEETFIEGWLTKEGEALGRPADIIILNESIYISDDKAGVIYLVTQ